MNAKFRGEQSKSEDPELLKFRINQEFIRTALVRICRNILRNPAVSPESAFHATCFLWAFLHLPRLRSEVSGNLSIIYRHGSDWGSKNVAIGSDGLELSTLESFDSGHGNDTESTLHFSVSTASRDQRDNDLSLQEWLQVFVNDTADPDAEYSIECYHSESINFLEDLPQDSAWPQHLENEF